METAIVMPLFVFLVLGLLQLGLMHQARLLAKYAAYKAVRVGSIHNAKMSAMRREAMAVMMPMMGRRNSPSFYNATAGKFAASWASADQQVDKSGTDSPLEVTICDPVGQVSGDFDDPYSGMGFNGGSWEGLNKGRLSIQLQVNYQLVVPFANGVMWHIARGTERVELLRNLRMASANDTYQGQMRARATAQGGARTIESFAGLVNDTASSVYIMPIRASWSLRMQSNYLNKQGFKLPATNKCRVAWKKGS